MNPKMMEVVADGRRYKTKDATLLASDAFFDGRNWERHGRNTFLLRTPRGSFFLQKQTTIRGEWDEIIPLTQREAEEWHAKLPMRAVAYEECFPGVEVEDA
jgi:hypothetical protein